MPTLTHLMNDDNAKNENSKFTYIAIDSVEEKNGQFNEKSITHYSINTYITVSNR